MPASPTPNGGRLGLEQAREIAEAVLRSYAGPDGDYVIIDEETVKTTYAWIFPYRSRRALHREATATGVRNGPLVVMAATGDVHDVAPPGSL